MLLAALVTPALRSLDQAYQFIQEYVGFISPGVLAIFMLGMFWKPTTSAAAMAGALLTIPVSTISQVFAAVDQQCFSKFSFP
jgi:SSS family solute:Na+ symporter